MHHRLAARHALDWRRHYSVALSLVVAIFAAAALCANAHNHPLAALGLALDMAPECLSWLHYPSYAAVLELPSPPSPWPLPWPPSSLVKRQYRRSRRCWHPDKRHVHPNLSTRTHGEIVALVEDAKDKLLAGPILPWAMRTPADRQHHGEATESLYWHAHLPMPRALRAMPRCAGDCTMRRAVAVRLLTPYWRADACLPCTLEQGVPWTAYIKPSLFPLPPRLWDASLLPPRRVHAFWHSDSLDSLAARDWAWALLRRWGRHGITTREAAGRARAALATAERIRLVEAGWMAPEAWNGGDVEWEAYVAERTRQDSDAETEAAWDMRGRVVRALLWSGMAEARYVVDGWDEYAQGHVPDTFTARPGECV
jgi:hypothetical protein